MIAILDYGVGNVRSIVNMLKKIGHEGVITADNAVIAAADKLILPGVGAFDYGMDRLREAPYFDLINQRALEEKIPVLGICLGAQLLMDGSEEGDTPGLGWIPGRSVRFDLNGSAQRLTVPHMGWSDVSTTREDVLFEGLEGEARFYFVHSYHLKPASEAHILCTTEYGIPYVAGIRHGNIAGVQFHPEKSHRFGKQLLKNFVNQSA
ncbi:MAG: imidazole glycerol phosphate synthase subunit HisH [Bacteroidota bacterium]